MPPPAELCRHLRRASSCRICFSGSNTFTLCAQAMRGCRENTRGYEDILALSVHEEWMSKIAMRVKLSDFRDEEQYAARLYHSGCHGCPDLTRPRHYDTIKFSTMRALRGQLWHARARDAICHCWASQSGCCAALLHDGTVRTRNRKHSVCRDIQASAGDRVWQGQPLLCVDDAVMSRAHDDRHARRAPAKSESTSHAESCQAPPTWCCM